MISFMDRETELTRTIALVEGMVYSESGRGESWRERPAEARGRFRTTMRLRTNGRQGRTAASEEGETLSQR